MQGHLNTERFIEKSHTQKPTHSNRRGIKKKKKGFDDVKTSQLSYTPLDTHIEKRKKKSEGVNKKVQAEKKVSDKFNLQGLKSRHADRPI